MNIESTTATITKTADASTPASSTNTSTKDGTTTFRNELESVKTKDVKAAQEVQAKEEAKTAETETTQNILNTENTQKSASENFAQQLAKDKLTKAEDKTNKLSKASEVSEDKKTLAPLNELNSKIATLNDLKNASKFVTPSIVSNNVDKTSDKGDYCQSIKMDNKDSMFFLNLVQNQQMAAQNSQINNVNSTNNNFIEVKTEATQSTVQVSQVLIDALNNSAKTGKPFRIDFEGDIAVILKVDKEGTLSANFIPGSAAVEAYLKNNIAGLRQNFNDQGLQYNELSYSNQQKQQKQQKQKENEDE